MLLRDQLRWESQLSIEADKREALTDIAKSCLSRMWAQKKIGIEASMDNFLANVCCNPSREPRPVPKGFGVKGFCVFLKKENLLDIPMLIGVIW